MILSPHEAQRVILDCVCSNCWGKLNSYHAPDNMVRVECVNCEGDTRGFTSREMAKLRKKESQKELIEVLNNYPHLKPDSGEQSADESIEQLGF